MCHVAVEHTIWESCLNSLVRCAKWRPCESLGLPKWWCSNWKSFTSFPFTSINDSRRYHHKQNNRNLLTSNIPLRNGTKSPERCISSSESPCSSPKSQQGPNAEVSVTKALHLGAESLLGTWTMFNKLPSATSTNPTPRKFLPQSQKRSDFFTLLHLCTAMHFSNFYHVLSSVLNGEIG